MPQPIRILIVEDDPLDAELLIRELRNAGFAPDWQRVDNEEAFLKHLHKDLDIILSDYQMPQFNGIRALELLKHSGLEIPFIIVSGAIGEDIAILAIKLGVADYLLKDRLARLGQAITQALEQTQLRKERQLITDALKKAESRYRKIFENATEGIFQTTPEGKVLLGNPALARITGYSSAQELMDNGKNARLRYVDPTKRDELKRLLEEHGSISGFETQLQLKDGTLLWVSINAQVVRNENGEIVYEGTLQDINERKKTEEALLHSQEQLLQAQKMEAIGRLAGGIAHDFNNLLTVINGHTEIANLHIAQTDAITLHLKEIHKAVERATTLTRQLLAFSRKQVIQPQIINLNNIVIDMEKMLRRVIGEDIELITLLEPNLWNIKVGPSHIDQILMNLVVNSRDAMVSGGKILIETSNIEFTSAHIDPQLNIAPGEYIQLSVIDTGCGIDEATMAHIFEPFFTTKELGKGTGLGLSTVYGIVKQNNGGIKIISEFNKGTKFQILLPRETGSIELPQRIAEEIKRPGHATILLVEDDEAIRMLVDWILTEAGHKVLAAANGKEALQICQTLPKVDMVMTDVIMPYMSVGEMVKELKKIYPGLKILYSSGYADSIIADQGVVAPGTYFIAKPFNMDELIDKIAEVLTCSIT